MKKYSALTIFENTLIILLVMTVVFFSWQILTKKTIDIAKLSKVETAGTSARWSQAFEDALALFNGNPTNANRTETAGALGQLIAECNSTGNQEICDYVLDQLQNSPFGLTLEQAKSCAQNMASCETLMTVTDFDWTPVNSQEYLDKTYCLIKGKGDLKDPLPITLKYTYNYINEKGEQVTESFTQTVYIQTEQFEKEAWRGKSLSAFLSDYMPKMFGGTSTTNTFTGPAITVQSNINAYMNRQDCELSKTKSEYVNFVNHSDETFSGCEDKATGCGITPDY